MDGQGQGFGLVGFNCMCPKKNRKREGRDLGGDVRVLLLQITFPHHTHTTCLPALACLPTSFFPALPCLCSMPAHTTSHLCLPLHTPPTPSTLHTPAHPLCLPTFFSLICLPVPATILYPYALPVPAPAPMYTHTPPPHLPLPHTHTASSACLLPSLPHTFYTTHTHTPAFLPCTPISTPSCHAHSIPPLLISCHRLINRGRRAG